MIDRQAAAGAPSSALSLPALHHQLRSALAAATLSLETFQLIGARSATQLDEQSTRSIDRALSSLQEALRLADAIRELETASLDESTLSKPGQSPAKPSPA